jgi:CPA1 family monovalent cation:H+ antiporter
MELFHLFSILLVLAVLFAYINFRVVKLPGTIGLMAVSLFFSILILLSGQLLSPVRNMVADMLVKIDFSDLLLEGMLSFMLFAGAIPIKYDDLKSEKLSIFFFSTVSVIISTFVVGLVTFYLLSLFGIKISLINALLFGALISPTDPIAVLSILKNAGIPKSMETKIAGESLFNDGVAVVVFITILQLAKPGAELNTGNILLLFGQEAIGGIILGIILGFVGYKLFSSIDNYKIEVLLTLAIVMGGYTLAHFIHVSGPLAMVVAGLITGNRGKSMGMSETTAEYVDKFWELIDEILNTLLFVLIGMELLIIKSNITIIIISVLLIVVIIGTRFFSVWLPSMIIRLKEKIPRSTLIVLTWGGLRGGISIALALSVPDHLNKDILVTITYIVVCFSILVQGLTISKVAKKYGRRSS